MKTSVFSLFFGFWLIVSIFVQTCDFEYSREGIARKEKARAAERAQYEAKRNEIVDALSTAHKADDTWDQGLRLSTWTVDLQNRIVGKPIVSSGILMDVSLGQDGKHYLHLIKADVGGPRLEFLLSCSKPQRSSEGQDLPEYFFVAKVESGSKDRRYTASELMIGISDEGRRFTVRGECLEMRLNEDQVRSDQKAAETRKKRE